MINPKLQETHHFILVTESKSVNRASRPKCCRGGRNLAIWLRTSCSRASREAEQIPPILGGCLACAEIGSWSLTWILCVCLSHTDTHTHTDSHTFLSCSAYHPHVEKNNCRCYRSFLSGYYKRGTPVCPGPIYALNGPAKVSSVQPI